MNLVFLEGEAILVPYVFQPGSRARAKIGFENLISASFQSERCPNTGKTLRVE
jgi:hypothetical protein